MVVTQRRFQIAPSQRVLVTAGIDAEQVSQLQYAGRVKPFVLIDFGTDDEALQQLHRKAGATTTEEVDEVRAVAVATQVERAIHHPE